MPGVFVPTFLPGTQQPTPETLAHARRVAEEFVAQMKDLPWTPQVGDVLAVAFTVLHFTEPNK